MDWLDANANLLPLDTSADFSPGAGGDALGRICKYGPATLDETRAQLEQMRDALLDSKVAPGAIEVRDFARRTRLALDLFLESDVPQELREEAAELEEWARDLPASMPGWDSLRRRGAAILEMRDAGKALGDARGPLVSQVEALSSLVSAGPLERAGDAIRLIPDRKILEPIQLRLPGL